MVDLLLATFGLGIAGLDPFGALVVAAALTAGSTRRSVLGFLVASAVTTIAVGGLLGRALEPVLTSIGSLLDLPDAVWAAVNIALVVALVAWAVARMRQRQQSGANSEPQRRGGLSSWSLTGAGVLFGLSMLTDPAYYAVIALGTQVEPWAMLVLAVALWFLISQSLLVILIASSFLGLHEKATRWLQSRWDRSKLYIRPVVTAAILVAATVLSADTVHFFLRGEFLIG